MKNYFLFLFLFVPSLFYAQNELPEIRILDVGITGSMMTLSYDVSDVDNNDVFIRFLVSDNQGQSFQVETENASGDLEMVSVGENKGIYWDFDGKLSPIGPYIIKLIADDLEEVNIAELVSQVDSNRIFNDLSSIVGIRHRVTGLDHLNEVRQLVQDRMNNGNLNIDSQTFVKNGSTGENFVGTRFGTESENEIVIFDAHYDGVEVSPAADDNGTGLAALLEGIRILSAYNFKKTVRFIGFDMEEDGLFGSIDYVTNYSKTDSIIGVLNLEACGFYSEEPNSQTFPFGFNFLFPDVYNTVKDDDFRGNFIANVAVVDQNEWEQVFVEAAKEFVPDLKVVTIVAPSDWQSLTPDLARSDHAPFWFTKIPAVMLTGTANFRNENYHKASDTLGTINFPFLTKVTKASIATIAKAAGIQHSSSAFRLFDITLENEDLSSNLNFDIFPVPFNHQLNFRLKQSLESELDLKIYHVSGIEVYRQHISRNATNLSISTDEWESGLYIIEFGGKNVKLVKL